MRWIMLLPFQWNYNQNINIDDYAASRGMSVSWFIRNFKKYTGSTPMQFIVGIRINNAQMLLETTTYSINEISKIVGYDNQLYFSRIFTSWKDIRRENTESWETNSEIHKEDTTELSKQ